VLADELEPVPDGAVVSVPVRDLVEVDVVGVLARAAEMAALGVGLHELVTAVACEVPDRPLDVSIELDDPHVLDVEEGLEFGSAVLPRLGGDPRDLTGDSHAAVQLLEDVLVGQSVASHVRGGIHGTAAVVTLIGDETDRIDGPPVHELDVGKVVVHPLEHLVVRAVHAEFPGIALKGAVGAVSSVREDRCAIAVPEVGHLDDEIGGRRRQLGVLHQAVVLEGTTPLGRIREQVANVAVCQGHAIAGCQGFCRFVAALVFVVDDAVVDTRVGLAVGVARAVDVEGIGLHVASVLEEILDPAVGLEVHVLEGLVLLGAAPLDVREDVILQDLVHRAVGTVLEHRTRQGVDVAPRTRGEDGLVVVDLDALVPVGEFHVRGATRGTEGIGCLEVELGRAVAGDVAVAAVQQVHVWLGCERRARHDHRQAGRNGQAGDAPLVLVHDLCTSMCLRKGTGVMKSAFIGTPL